MKKINYLNLIIYTTIFVVLLSSCNNDDDTNLSNDNTENSENSDSSDNSTNFDQISDIATFNGNLKGDIVILHAQSGPSTELNDDETTNGIITDLGLQSTLYVTVHQAQTKKPNLFTNSEITFEEAKQFDLESVSNLKRVADFFKNQEGKTVYILGVSFGSFLVQELIATHGIDVADGYLVLANRLNVDKEIWQPLSQGIFKRYVYDEDGNYTIVPEDDPYNETIEGKNMGRLTAGFAFNRYTDRLKNISSLSKLTYIYGDRDDIAGSLSDQEIQFLNEKGANVILSEGANHDEAVGEGAIRLKEIFDIE